ncbi:MAG: hypothetical protein HYV07_17120 [Deltaproteobacteria bacterium]|nr:hypothetical protein [Deltaproteobacteria bacterium]
MTTEPDAAPSRFGRRVIAPHLILAALAVALSILSLQNSRKFAAISQEDGPVEWATFFAFAFASILGVAYAEKELRAATRKPVAVIGALGLTAFCVFVAGEELSWGQRVFGFRPPDLFLEHNFQQETNLHNFLKNILDTRWVVAFIAILYGATLPFVPQRGILRHLDGVVPLRSFAPWFGLVGLTEIVYPVDLAGESAELGLGMVFIADLASRTDRLAIASLAQALALAIGAVTGPALDSIIEGRGAALVPLAKTELEALSRDVAKGARRKLDKKRQVHKRVFTARRSAYFKLSKGDFVSLPADEDARARRRFFVDPWQQPYWIFVQNRGGETTRWVYSFGPNRKRESELGFPPKQTGDDVFVPIEARERAATSSTAIGP